MGRIILNVRGGQLAISLRILFYKENYVMNDKKMLSCV